MYCIFTLYGQANTIEDFCIIYVSYQNIIMCLKIMAQVHHVTRRHESKQTVTEHTVAYAV